MARVTSTATGWPAEPDALVVDRKHAESLTGLSSPQLRALVAQGTIRALRYRSQVWYPIAQLNAWKKSQKGGGR